MIHLAAPRIEIDLAKIAHNAETLINLYGSKGIGAMAVTKAVCGDPIVAEVLIKQNIGILADSKLKNIRKMRESGINAQFVLLKIPAISEVDSVIKYANISINTELIVIRKLSKVAIDKNIRHKIILMVEMGDLREGILPKDLDEFIQEVLGLPGIEIVGIGANFACFGGVKPSTEKMAQLSSLAEHIEAKFMLPLSLVSGGNSANYNWFLSINNTGKINNVRLGESIYLGRETLNRMAIPGLYTDAFTFVSEIIEAKSKPSVPYGEIGQDAFGNIPEFQDVGQMNRAIMGVGSQDVLIPGLTPRIDIDILGSSSDHTVLNIKNSGLKVGDEVMYDVNYGALLSAMTSPYVAKEYTGINYKPLKMSIQKESTIAVQK